jgi:hypothetical protein
MTMEALRTGGIAAAVMSSTGGVMGACNVMRGRGWCHKCVALGCYGQAQTFTTSTIVKLCASKAHHGPSTEPLQRWTRWTRATTPQSTHYTTWCSILVCIDVTRPHGWPRTSSRPRQERSKALLRRAQRPPAASRTSAHLQRVM